MYQLLLKQRFKFAVRMIKRNIGAYLILIAIVPCILILQSMIQTRKKQIMYQYFAIVLITMLLSQIEGKYIEYVLLFSILILGQNVVSYNVQNELRLVKKGFPLRYSLKEKLQCKSVIGMFLLLLPMLCYWIAYKFELFSILLWIWMPIQSIIIYTAKNRLQRLLYILPFYILSLLSMRVW